MGSSPAKLKRPSLSEQPELAEPMFVRSASAPHATPTIVVDSAGEHQQQKQNQLQHKPPAAGGGGGGSASKKIFKKKSSIKPVMTKSESVAVESASEQAAKFKNQRSLSVNALNCVPANQTSSSNPGSVHGSPPPSRGYKTIKNRCYYCGAADHSHDLCAKGEPVECQKCHERGHMEKYCDRFHMQ